ncbi:MAG: Mobile element protein, partial [uncultured Chloroflexia bacterium]
SRLCHQPADQEAHRGSVRLGQDGGRVARGTPPWPRQDRLAVHLRHGRLQPRQIAEAPRVRLVM